MSERNDLSSRSNSIIFVDYKPAELRINKDWLLVFYAKNPLTNKLERERIRVPKISPQKERLKHAKKMQAGINARLAEGWLPSFENAGKNSFKPFREVCDKFLEQAVKEVEDGAKSDDTLRSYKSFLSLIQQYITLKEIKMMFSLEYTAEFVVNYLDWIYYDRENSPRTYNNHLDFSITLSNFMIQRGYIKEDPTLTIKKKRPGQKIRQVYTAAQKEILKKALPQYGFGYMALCMCTYYSLIRRKELTNIQVRDLDFNNNTFVIQLGNGKYKKMTEFVTIPQELKGILLLQTENAGAEDYVFSKNNFKAGPEKLAPKKITDTFTKIRTQYQLPKTLQWYGLKDTGITDLFDAGLSSLKIRDHARHKNLKTTELYTRKNPAGDPALRDSGLSF